MKNYQIKPAMLAIIGWALCLFLPNLYRYDWLRVLPMESVQQSAFLVGAGLYILCLYYFIVIMLNSKLLKVDYAVWVITCIAAILLMVDWFGFRYGPIADKGGLIPHQLCQMLLYATARGYFVWRLYKATPWKDIAAKVLWLLLLCKEIYANIEFWIAKGLIHYPKVYNWIDWQIVNQKENISTFERYFGLWGYYGPKAILFLVFILGIYLAFRSARKTLPGIRWFMLEQAIYKFKKDLPILNNDHADFCKKAIKQYDTSCYLAIIAPKNITGYLCSIFKESIGHVGIVAGDKFVGKKHSKFGIWPFTDAMKKNYQFVPIEKHPELIIKKASLIAKWCDTGLKQYGFNIRHFKYGIYYNLWNPLNWFGWVGKYIIRHSALNMFKCKISCHWAVEIILGKKIGEILK